MVFILTCEMVQRVLCCNVQEARTNYRNFRDLLWNLIFKKHWNDLEKARYVGLLIRKLVGMHCELAVF